MLYKDNIDESLHDNALVKLLEPLWWLSKCFVSFSVLGVRQKTAKSL